MRAALGLLAFTAMIAVGAQGSLAYFTDTATAQPGTMTAGAVTSQATPTCSSIFLSTSVRLTWTQTHPRNVYSWEVRPVGSTTVVASGTAGAGTALNGTITVDVGPGTFANGNYSFVVQARLASPSTWVASTTTSTPIRRATPLVNQMYCGNL